MSAFAEVALPLEADLPQVCEVDTTCKFSCERRQIILPPRAERTRAEGDAVLPLRHGFKQAQVALPPRDDARKPEHIPRRVVRMDCHVDAGFPTGRQDAAQETDQIFKQPLMRHAGIGIQQTAQFGGTIAFVPAGQMQVVRVERGQLRVTVGQ